MERKLDGLKREVGGVTPIDLAHRRDTQTRNRTFSFDTHGLLSLLSLGYLPVQCGLRFSAKACGPSRKSCEESSTFRRSRSATIASSMGSARPAMADSLVRRTLRGEHSSI